MEYDLVKMWLRKDPIRWIAGALAGILSTAVTFGVSAGLSTMAGKEATFLPKLVASVLLGPEALRYGPHGTPIGVGLVVFGALLMFLGAVYAHFVGTNKMIALLPMGLVWGIFSWIFLWNLYFQSFHMIRSAQIGSGPTLLICVVSGLSLASVSFIDRAIRGRALD